ncbi:apelin receptor early endogenous ligand [Sorex araneus]|uniref:apelin receptor early endogenous ligand n=1 Tax=Sorex araneus TaxID=42254 RepID=UPI00064B3478|nr:apelin receptor early endogenous ligand [Sorex araneus]
MRIQQVFFVVIFLLSLVLTDGQRTATRATRRKSYRKNCHKRRCRPLHSRVPFP